MNEYRVEDEFGMSEYPTVLEFVAGAVLVFGMFALTWVALVAFG